MSIVPSSDDLARAVQNVLDRGGSIDPAVSRSLEETNTDQEDIWLLDLIETGYAACPYRYFFRLIDDVNETMGKAPLTQEEKTETTTPNSLLPFSKVMSMLKMVKWEYGYYQERLKKERPLLVTKMSESRLSEAQRSAFLLRMDEILNDSATNVTQKWKALKDIERVTDTIEKAQSQIHQLSDDHQITPELGQRLQQELDEITQLSMEDPQREVLVEKLDTALFKVKYLVKERNEQQLEIEKGAQAVGSVEARRLQQDIQHAAAPLESDDFASSQSMEAQELIARLQALKWKVPPYVEKVFYHLLTEIKSHERSNKCVGVASKNLRWLCYLTQSQALKDVCLPLALGRTSRNVVGGSFDRYQSNFEGTVFVQRENDHSIQVEHGAGLTQSIAACPQHYLILLVAVGWTDDETKEYSKHQNLIFINKDDKSYERFEPNGGTSFPFVDDMFESPEFRALLPSPDYRYIAPSEVCPSLGPQGRQAPDVACSTGGLCQVFSVMFAHLRMLLPHIPSEDIYNLWLSLTNDDLLDVCKRYLQWMDETVPDMTDKRIRAFDAKYLPFAKGDIQYTNLAASKCVIS
jgi:hypothetical protein